MLLLLERDKGKLKDGHGRYYANTTAADVEHVLEKSLKFADKAADYVFTQAEFDSVDGKPNDGSIKHRLGNRMLLPRATNQHIKKLSFAGKMNVPGCRVGNNCGGNYHYVPNRAEYAYVDEFLNRYQAGALWNPTNIDDWEKHLISEFIDLSI